MNESESFETDDIAHKKFIEKMMKNGDLSKHFGDKSMNIDDYAVAEYSGGNN